MPLFREASFKKSSLAELGAGARSFAGDPEDCCVRGGRGTVARAWGIGWRSGAAGGVKKLAKTDIAVKIKKGRRRLGPLR